MDSTDKTNLSWDTTETTGTPAASNAGKQILSFEEALQRRIGFNGDLNNHDAVADAICAASSASIHVLVADLTGVNTTPTHNQFENAAEILAYRIVSDHKYEFLRVVDPQFSDVMDSYYAASDDQIWKWLYEELSYDAAHEDKENEWHAEFWDDPEFDLHNALHSWLLDDDCPLSEDAIAEALDACDDSYSARQWIDSHPECGFDTSPYDWDNDGGNNPKPTRIEIWDEYRTSSYFVRSLDDLRYAIATESEFIGPNDVVSLARDNWSDYGELTTDDILGESCDDDAVQALLSSIHADVLRAARVFEHIFTIANDT